MECEVCRRDKHFLRDYKDLQVCQRCVDREELFLKEDRKIQMM